MKAAKETRTIVQGVIFPQQKGVKVFVPFREGVRKSDIQTIVPGCGCTANVTWDSDGATASYSDNTPKADVEKYPTKTKTVTKHLTIYHNDGKPLKVSHPGKGKIYNPRKSKEVVYFDVTVSTNLEV